MRLYELAKQLGAQPRDLLHIANTLDAGGFNPRSRIETKHAREIEEKWRAGQRSPNRGAGPSERTVGEAAEQLGMAVDELVSEARKRHVPIRTGRDVLDQAQDSRLVPLKAPPPSPVVAASPTRMAWLDWKKCFLLWGSPDAERAEFVGDAVLGASAALALADALPWRLESDRFASDLSRYTSNAAILDMGMRSGLVAAAEMPATGKRGADAVEAFIGELWLQNHRQDACAVSVGMSLGAAPAARHRPAQWPGTASIPDPRGHDRRQVPSVVKAVEIATGRLTDDWRLAAYCLHGGGGAPHDRLRSIGIAVTKLQLAEQAIQKGLRRPGKLTAAVSQKLERKWLATCQQQNRWLDQSLGVDIIAEAAQALVGAAAIEAGLIAGMQVAATLVLPRDEHAARVAWKQQWELRRRTQ